MQHSLWKLYSILNNGLTANKFSVIHPHKKICRDVLAVMYKEGYINGFRKLPRQSDKIEIFLKYVNGKSAISKFSVGSKPSRRIYLPLALLWKLKTSVYTLVLSTPKGVLSDRECRKFHTGGEVLCIIF